jgi:Mg-chelatase subunit ChlD
MAGRKLLAAKEAAIRFTLRLAESLSSVGVASFSIDASRDVEPTDDYRSVVRGISAAQSGGGTNLVAAVSAGLDMIAASGGGVPRVIVLLSDGQHSDNTVGISEIWAPVQEIRRQGIDLFTVGLGDGADGVTLSAIASGRGKYYASPNERELAAIYSDIAGIVSERRQLFREATVTDVVPDNMAYQTGSADPPPTTYNPDTRTITWVLRDVREPGLHLSYDLFPLVPGRWPTNREAHVDYVDVNGDTGRLAFPVPHVRVVAPTPLPTSSPSATSSATATWTPSASPTATATGSPTATASATASFTSSATPTLTPSDTPTASPTYVPTRRPPPRLYLPLLLREKCPPEDLFADIVLVVDASTSMKEITQDGRRKIDTAVDAVRAFLDGLRLKPGQDQASIIVFNSTATRLQGLTSDCTRLEAALERIALARQSRVDLAIDRATVELLARGRPDQMQAMVVLSDGRANPVPGDVAVAAARAAQGEGIAVYVVGMGPSLDERVLRLMASGADQYFPAPDPLMIRTIYADLSRRVPCPASAYWGRR